MPVIEPRCGDLEVVGKVLAPEESRGTDYLSRVRKPDDFDALSILPEHWRD